MIPATVVVATVSLSVSVAVRYVEVKCSQCSKRLVDLPAEGGRIIVRVRESQTDLSGGIAARCPRCKSLVEVIRHG